VGLADLAVAEVRVDRPQRLSNRHSGALDSPDPLSEHQHAVSRLPDLADLEPEVVEVVDPLGQQPPQPFRTTIFGLANPLRERIVHAVGCEESLRHLDSASREGVIGSAHDLDVFL